MVSAVCGGIRFVSLYAPNGRVVGSPFYEGKLRWFERLARWLAETRSPDEPLVLGGDYNVAPADEDVWSPARAHGGTHVSEPERAALARLRDWGLVDGYRAYAGDAPGRFSWWDYRAGMFHRNEGMRIDLLYATAPVAARVIWAEIDREARKGPPMPSDHAPVVIDLDAPGKPVRRGLERRPGADRRPDEAAAVGLAAGVPRPTGGPDHPGPTLVGGVGWGRGWRGVGDDPRGLLGGVGARGDARRHARTSPPSPPSSVSGGAGGGGVRLEGFAGGGGGVNEGGGPRLVVGGRYLVSGEDNLLWGCGFTRP